MKKILDVGAGYNPWKDATMLCDVCITPTDHSDGRYAVRDDRPYIVCDMQYLPFKDKSIDFVHSSHAIEHVPNAYLALKELKRVGKRGHIRFPSQFWEKVINWTHVHEWAIDPTGEQHETVRTGFHVAFKRIKRFIILKNWGIRFRERIPVLDFLRKLSLFESKIEW